MSTDDILYEDEKYADYELMYDPIERAHYEQQLHPARIRKEKSWYWETVQTLADVDGLEAGFRTTYRPSRYEEGWLLDALRPFYSEGLISDVLLQVKGGKEACVYCCRASEDLGGGLFAAKVYRPRMFRNLRNDKLYRQGRQVLTETGRPVNKSDHRTMRALGKRTAYGMQVSHTSWLMHEKVTLQRLYDKGVAVPRPYASGPNAILMDYVGDARQPAPTLNGVALEPNEAHALFERLIADVETMLAQGLIHGDLSAYNVLYWQGDVTLIDFPQVIEWHVNRQAKRIFERDLVRLCDYFQAQGVDCDAQTVADQLWDRHVQEAPVIPPLFFIDSSTEWDEDLHDEEWAEDRY